LGPILIENNMDKLVRCLVTLIGREGKCQIPFDEEEETEEDQETDAKIWEPITDLVPKLSKHLGDSFGPYFEQLLEALMPYAS